MSSKSINVDVDVDIDLDEWTDEELIEELTRRKVHLSRAAIPATNAQTFAQRIYESWSRDPAPVIKDFVYQYYGRIIN